MSEPGKIFGYGKRRVVASPATADDGMCKRAEREGSFLTVGPCRAVPPIH
jgi:hypothetical protein